MDDVSHRFTGEAEPEFHVREFDASAGEVTLGVVAVHTIRHKAVTITILETCDGVFAVGHNINRDQDLSQTIARSHAARDLRGIRRRYANREKRRAEAAAALQ